MSKRDVLSHLADVDGADAFNVAHALDVSYATAAMALLRLVRQGLARRVLDPGRGVYAYELSDHGHARLAFFDGEPPAPRLSEPARPSSGKGIATMKRKKLHNGVYHCPACFIEFDLVAEESLQCDQCHGPLAKGSLDAVWDDEANDE